MASPINIITLAMAKKYTQDTASDLGSLKGAPCTVKSIVTSGKNHVVTLEWTSSSGTTQEQSFTLKDGEDGDDAYEVAVSQGYVGTKEEWLESLVGASAYEIAVSLGYEGTEEEWIASLKGEPGTNGKGVSSVVKVSTVGNVDTYKMTFTDNTFITYTVTNSTSKTKLSEFENDEEFVKKTTDALINYYTKSQLYTKNEIAELLRNIGAGLQVKVVSSLPISDISPTTIYLIASYQGQGYTQYMYISGVWALLGTTEIDLSEYATRAYVTEKIADFLTSDDLISALADYTPTASLAPVALSNDYRDLDNLPTVPEPYELPVASTTVLGGVKAGDNVTIDQYGVLSAGNTTYELPPATSEELGGVIVGDNLTVSEYGVLSADEYTAGTNVQISNDKEISATDTTYTAGTNVQISNENVISATDTTYTAGTNVQISNENEISATDTTYSAGTNVTINAQNEISAMDTTYSVTSPLAMDANNDISATFDNAPTQNSGNFISSGEVYKIKDEVDNINKYYTKSLTIQSAGSDSFIVTNFTGTIFDVKQTSEASNHEWYAFKGVDRTNDGKQVITFDRTIPANVTLTVTLYLI